MPSENDKQEEFDPYVVACQISDKPIQQMAGKTLWVQDSGRSRRVSRWKLLNPQDLPIKPLRARTCQILKNEFGIVDIATLSYGILECLEERLQELGYADAKEIYNEVAETKDSLQQWIKVCQLGKGKRVDIPRLAATVQRALHRRHREITEKTGATISTESFIADLDLDRESESDIQSLSESDDHIHPSTATWNRDSSDELSL